MLHQAWPAAAFFKASSSGLAQRCALVLLATTSAAGDDAAQQQQLPTDAYFEEYGSLYDHIGMLQDHERMGAYHDAIKLNAKRHFEGKVVLDVGTGTGVLSIWAAQAGAKKVYAIEATNVATHAERLVAAHGFSDVITVLKGRMEQIELPEKVDVLLSEWMGYFLLREAMVNSVIDARDQYLKPGGVMYPSSARLLISSMEEAGFVEARLADAQDAMAGWEELSVSLKSRYGLEMEALKGAYEAENMDYAINQAWQGAVAPHATFGEPQVLLDVDMGTVTKADLFGWRRRLRIPEASASSAVRLLCGWFDVRFCASGSEQGGDREARAGAGDPSCVELTTSPTAAYTHWAHTTFVLEPPLRTPELTVGLTHSLRSHHDLNVTIGYEDAGAPVSASYAITAEFRTSDRSLQEEQGREENPAYDEAPPYAYDD